MKIGLDGMKQMLQAGVNDVGGTLNGENISQLEQSMDKC